MCVCITLKAMGKRDDRKSRTTREFDSARLAALTKEQLAEVQPQPNATPEEPPIIGRAATIDDPMTTGLLAEVARRSQTADFDEELVKEVLSKVDSGETNHPHTRKRSR